MNTKKHNWILYFIVVTIFTTIAVQFYWNYKNYQQNKLRVMNEIQISLDNAIEKYFTDLSKANHFSIITPKNDSKSSVKVGNVMKDIFLSIDNTRYPKKEKKAKTKEEAKDSTSLTFQSLVITTDNSNEYKNTAFVVDSFFSKKKKNILSHVHTDSIYCADSVNCIQTTGLSSVGDKIKVFKGKKAADSLKLIKGIQTLFIAIQNDTMNHSKIDTILKKELEKKQISVDYSFEYYKQDTIHTSFATKPVQTFATIESKSTFLGPDKRFKMKYSNPSAEALKRSFTGILLSLLLSLAVVFSLFYLLKIINDQKELAEIKNDLISNITHEFKTPITTVSTALEAINNFNAIEDKEKTKKYVSISESQIKKLHVMVEKLLETATLDSEKLLLKEEAVEIVSLLEKLSRKHQLFTTNKKIDFISNIEDLVIKVDEFHLENAISNLIDNAIKYGGDKIQFEFKSTSKDLQITVTDNGKGIDKNQQDKIFDKFYRVPKGNTHDVKGFGIGLYYTKKIIEKHNGTIQLHSIPGQTTFKITMSYE
ncbi:sensor histidine kinase [Tenacibaculum jejuense]|uniref:histidine kinase n=1 Tax=Tenacibaculum jejuense TaxID=584609 RepID=A0A238UE53_9FLAO|nr:HAMP domain-containing sensor histidine kinase [Tenacibaculum jejuense]SNR17335.1 Two-component system sensor histidine kinase [Tenacibaculum jejuense]